MTLNLKYTIFPLICYLWLIMKPLAAATSNLAKPGCADICGKITIPYPFGIGGPDCFLNEWYEVECLDERPYLSKYHISGSGGELLDVSLDLSTLTADSNSPSFSNISLCENKVLEFLSFDDRRDPFSFDSYNKIIVVGCGNVVLFNNSTVVDGCTTACDQERIIKGCYGVNCCEISSDFHTPYSLNFTNLGSVKQSCASVIFVEKSWTPKNLTSFTNPFGELAGVPIPLVLRWKITETMLPALKMNQNCNVDNDGVYNCSCPFCTEGNPYITDGCQVSLDKPYCVPIYRSRSRERVILLAVGGTSLGILFLLTSSLLLYKSITKRRKRKLKEQYFKRNGGLLLQQQISVDENTIDKVRLFTKSELGKATDNFNENRVLGRGGQGTVYKGMLVDGKIVAVKRSKLDDKKQVEQFINEIFLLSQINHRNVVKLLGCCLETDVPLLVYEFVPNGTLYDLLHNEDDEFLALWDMRLRIATEVAGALAYLHYATSVPIYHRDIKSNNILLDEKYIAKVSDFGISRNFTVDQTHLTTTVKGTFGYLDPQYFQSNQFTEKSDVYSFGVVLVELLTRQKPISDTCNTEESFLNLAGRFLTSMEEDRFNMILDTQILKTASDEQITRVATLAQRCLRLNGKRRPTMKEVAIELESIKLLSHLPSTVETNFQGKGKGKEKADQMELVSFSGGISSSTIANDPITYSFYNSPLLSDTF